LKARGVTWVPMVIVGNKIDLEQKREVTREEGEDFARSLKAIFLETSAQSGQNVQQCFQQMTKIILSARSPARTAEKRGGCCALV